MTDQPTIGFIGLGVMGKSMASNLLKAGYSLTVYNRTVAKAASLIEQGAVLKATPREVAESASILITMVGYPQDVEAIYFGSAGLLESAAPDSFLVDMTTSSPALAKRIAQAAAEKGLRALDAPVSGGDVGAREGKLAIMVGGAEEDFDALRPLFNALGSTIRLLGPAGSGQYTKMCNQIAIASNMLGVCEAVVYAKNAGLDPTAVLDVITGGAAGSWSLSNLAPRMLKGDFAPGFYVKHFIKDMKIALESAAEMGLQLPGLALAERLYEQLAAAGCENEGTQALCKLIESGNWK